MGKKNISAIESGAGFIGSLASKLVKCLRQKGVSDEEIYEMVREGDASDEMINKIADALVKKEVNEFLKLISGGESLVLDAVDGTETLYEASDVFAYRDSDLKNWGANQKGTATGKTPVQVHEIVKDANFSQTFNSLNADVKKLCFTQHQIKNFVKKYQNWLREDGYATFFLFESNNEFFVAYVYVYSGGKLSVNVDRFGDSNVWHAEYRHRLVVPQLATTQ
jgi:hypothetical protein